MNVLTKTLAAGAAALTLAVAFTPAAEARGRGWGGHPGWHGGHHRPWGWRHPRPWGPAVIGLGVYGGSCFITRKRVWDDYRGRFIIVRSRVCG